MVGGRKTTSISWSGQCTEPKPIDKHSGVSIEASWADAKSKKRMKDNLPEDLLVCTIRPQILFFCLEKDHRPTQEERIVLRRYCSVTKKKRVEQFLFISIVLKNPDKSPFTCTVQWQRKLDIFFDDSFFLPIHEDKVGWQYKGVECSCLWNTSEYTWAFLENYY